MEAISEHVGLLNQNYRIGKVEKIEVRENKNGDHVVNFTLNVIRPNVEGKTDFFNYVAYDEKADYISCACKRGDVIAVTGWDTKRNREVDGMVKIFFETRVDKVMNLTDIVKMYSNLR